MRDKSITRRNFLFGKSTNTDKQPALLPFYDEKGLTPNVHFFRQHLRHIPTITPVYWMLRLHGMVEKPLVITYDQLLTMPKAEQICTIVCNGGSTRNPMIGNAVWTGVPLSHLFHALNIAPQAHFAQLYAADGYTTYLEIDTLQASVLAYKMNGETLPPEHGFPVRLVAPGLSGFKMPKWIQRIEFTDNPKSGFWEARGWSPDGGVGATVYLFSPRHMETVRGNITLSGAAYAGTRPITAVEISIDDAPWMPVPITLSQPYRWTTWHIDWTPPAPGDYLIKVRAADSNYTSFPDESASRGTIIRVMA